MLGKTLFNLAGKGIQGDLFLVGFYQDSDKTDHGRGFNLIFITEAQEMIQERG